MSASQTPPANAPQTGADPSMEDILASIRRILSEDETGPTPLPGVDATPPALPSQQAETADDVLVLDPSMLVADAAPSPAPDPAPEPEPPSVTAPAPTLIAPEAAAAAASSVDSLVRTLAAGRTTQVHRGGPTIEDIVREEIRPLLKEWLDANLPPIVERFVRAEIERVVGRAVP
jgi:cell pole-organizing protein PopZ